MCKRNNMWKKEKIEEIHDLIMRYAEQIYVISDKISESESTKDVMVLAELSKNITLKIVKTNEKLGRIFKI